jgi:tetratricopeptide (TPR) repeat protein
MTTYYQDVSRKHEDDPDRSNNSPPETEGKNSKVCTETIEPENRSVSKKTSEKKLIEIEKNDPIRKSEVDLSYAPQGTGSERDKGRTEPKEETISIQNPAEAIFEVETQPAEESPSKEKLKTITPKERKPHPQKSKGEKLSRADLGSRRKAKGEEVPKKTRSRLSKPTAEQVFMSKGVAYLDGNAIRFAGGIKLCSGEQIKVGEKEFILKKRPRSRKPMYLSALALLVIAVLIFSPLLKEKSSGRLIGIVLDEKSKISLSNAQIQIKELGKEAQSNQLGFFTFDFVPPGSYTLQTSLKGYQMVNDNVTITKKQTTTISLSLSPKDLSGLPDRSSLGVVPIEKSASENAAQEGIEVEDQYGAIGVKSNVSEPVVLVDDRMMGMGNKVYKNISTGKHNLKLTKEGYQDFSQKIEVKPGKTLNLKIDLQEAQTVNPTPQTTDDWITLAQNQMNSNDLSSAVNSYTQALALNPKSSASLLGRGIVYHQLNDPAKAQEDLSKAAEYYTDEKNYNQAIVCYTHLLVLNGQDLKSFYNRGLCYLKLDQYEQSISDLEKTIQLDSKFFLGYLNLGEACYRAGNYEASLENYKKAKKLNPESPQLYAGMALAYLAKGEKSSAKKSYKKFEELSTYVDRERMKQDPEWRKLLEGIGE